MKIIHTSDWHLGKQLNGKSRKEEQLAALDNLLALVRDISADAVIIAGDIFDTVTPPAEAEDTFYSYALKISRYCPVIAIAGNHDNPERLSAPRGIAGECGIVLGGSLDYSGVKGDMEGGEGYIRLHKNGETVNMALLAYPSAAKMSQIGYKPDLSKSYQENVRDWLNICAKGFREGECNITVSHLFMAGSNRSSEEVELGTAAILPLDILPKAHYTALGHVHKPQCVSKSQNVYYSGSLLNYSFDDTTEKYFNVLHTSNSGVELEKVPVDAGKKLVTVTAASFEECINALKQNSGAYVKLIYSSPFPLTASQYAQIRSYDCFCDLIKSFEVKSAEQSKKRITDDPGELFKSYYAYKYDGKAPSDELTDMFFKAMRGEEL